MKGHTVVAKEAEQPAGGNVVDLMEALKRNIEGPGLSCYSRETVSEEILRVAIANHSHSSAQIVCGHGLVEDLLVFVLTHEHGRISANDDEWNALVREKPLKRFAVAIGKHEVNNCGVHPIPLQVDDDVRR